MNREILQIKKHFVSYRAIIFPSTHCANYQCRTITARVQKYQIACCRFSNSSNFQLSCKNCKLPSNGKLKMLMEINKRRCTWQFMFAFLVYDWELIKSISAVHEVWSVSLRVRLQVKVEVLCLHDGNWGGLFGF